MPLLSHKKIKHLARYFGIVGLLCILAYAFMPSVNLFLIPLGPPFFVVYWLRVHAGLLTAVIPNQPFYNHLFLILPITVVYFGLVGFQIKNILNERGKIRLLIMAAFVGFLIYLHYVAFQELSLYLAQPKESTHLGSARDLPLGDKEG